MITLTTDFGNSHYVAQMKASILKINPKAKILDITHEVPPHDVVSGAYALYAALPSFQDAVHICVVDPGVGGGRRGVIIECRNSFLVGPDNGLMVDAARKLGIVKCYEIREPELEFRTFHGRDIFAPVGAYLDIGKSPGELGERMDPSQLVDLSILDLEFGMDLQGVRYVKGKVLSIDRFGDCVTSITFDLVEGERPLFEIKGRKIGLRFLDSYSSSEPGEVIALVSSSGLIELASYRRRCSDVLHLRVGDPITILRPDTR
jgi:hypothetical protein